MSCFPSGGEPASCFPNGTACKGERLTAFRCNLDIALSSGDFKGHSDSAPTVGPRKVRLLGFQQRAYRLVYCWLHSYAASPTEVIRHRCDNRRCINPDHLTIGSRADNVRDDRGFRANGVDFDLL